MNRLTLLLAALVSAASLAQPVALFTAKSINLEPGQVDAFSTVCATQYAKAAGAEVIAPDRAQAAVGPNGSLVDAAKALSARELVELTLVSLESRGAGKVLVSGVRRSVDGQELARADLTADTLSDAVPVCERLALSLWRRTTPEAVRTRSNVTAAEAQATGAPNRMGSEKVIGVKTAFGAPVGSESYSAQGSVAFNARLEHERYFIELGAGILVPAMAQGALSYGGITTEIGASVYLTDGDFAPYVGGGLQPRIIFSGSILNLAPYVQAGLMFFRESSTRLYVDARVSQNVLPIGTSDSGASLFPTELTAQVGVGF